MTRARQQIVRDSVRPEHRAPREFGFERFPPAPDFVGLLLQPVSALLKLTLLADQFGACLFNGFPVFLGATFGLGQFAAALVELGVASGQQRLSLFQFITHTIQVAMVLRQARLFEFEGFFLPMESLEFILQTVAFVLETFLHGVKLVPTPIEFGASIGQR